MHSNINKFTINYTGKGHAYLNLACGIKTDERWNNLDFSPYAKLRKRMWMSKLFKRLGLISMQRWERLNKIDPNIICWDLRKGIPFSENTFDAVYNSHFLEHLPKEASLPFLKECFRVCKQGGVIRVVVPDLEALSMRYLECVKEIDSGKDEWALYSDILNHLFEQMIRVESAGVKEQKPFNAFFERLIRGEARETGELHLWMYDRLSLRCLLEDAGFANISVRKYNTSLIPDWDTYELDQTEDGSEYKGESLYIEAVKLR